MTQSFHPAAARRIDERGIALLAGFEQGPPGPVTESEPLGDVHISGTLTDADLVGPISNTFYDRNGSEIGRVISKSGITVGLRAEAHREFLALADAMRKSPQCRATVSQTTMREWLWKWLSERLPGTLSAFVEAQMREKVVEQRIVVPVYELFIPVRIALPGVALLTLSRELLDELDEFERCRTPEDVRPLLASVHERRRMELQGKAAAVVVVTAESAFAGEYALERTEVVLAILRLVSRGMAVARSRSYCTVRGAEAVQTRQLFRFDAEHLRANRSWIASPTPQHWVLEEAKLPSMLEWLGPWLRLLELEGERTDFQERALKAALIFSRATLQERLGEKLLHALSGLESVLLKNETEPIVIALADRSAFLAEADPLKRQEKAKLLRTIYTFRSRFVHHAEEVEAAPFELEQIESFMLHAMLTLRALAVKSLVGGLRADCLDELDAMKYG